MIDVYVYNGKAFIWNAEDACLLRSKYRIIGSLVGCFPRKMFQNSEQWLPLQLLPEEAVLLVEKGLAQLVTNQKVGKPIDNTVKEYFLEIRDKLCEEQIEKAAENRKKEILEKSDEIYAGKKRKLQQLHQKKKKKRKTEVACDESNQSAEYNTDSQSSLSEKFEMEPSSPGDTFGFRNVSADGDDIESVKSVSSDSLYTESENIQQGTGLANEDESEVQNSKQTEKTNTVFLIEDTNSCNANDKKQFFSQGDKHTISSQTDSAVSKDRAIKDNSQNFREKYSISNENTSSDSNQLVINTSLGASSNNDSSKELDTTFDKTKDEISNANLCVTAETENSVCTEQKEINSKSTSENNDDKQDASKDLEANKELNKDENLVADKNDDIVNKNDVIEKEMSRIPKMSKDFCMVQLFTECIWKKTENNISAKLNYPKTEKEKLKCAVFKDLWEKGYYLTTGSKFGGDFLVYAGDPFKYHAIFIVLCFPRHKEFKAIDLVTFGRLGTQVKKTVVLASVDRKNYVDYISLNWASDVYKVK